MCVISMYFKRGDPMMNARLSCLPSHVLEVVPTVVVRVLGLTVQIFEICCRYFYYFVQGLAEDLNL